MRSNDGTDTSFTRQRRRKCVISNLTSISQRIVTSVCHKVTNRRLASPTVAASYFFSRCGITSIADWTKKMHQMQWHYSISWMWPGTVLTSCIGLFGTTAWNHTPVKFSNWLALVFFLITPRLLKALLIFNIRKLIARLLFRWAVFCNLNLYGMQ